LGTVAKALVGLGGRVHAAVAERGVEDAGGVNGVVAHVDRNVHRHLDDVARHHAPTSTRQPTAAAATIFLIILPPCWRTIPAVDRTCRNDSGGGGLRIGRRNHPSRLIVHRSATAWPFAAVDPVVGTKRWFGTAG